MKTIKLEHIKIIGSETFPDRAFNWQKDEDWFNITFEIPKKQFPEIQKFLECEVPITAKPFYHTFDLILNKYYRKK